MEGGLEAMSTIRSMRGLGGSILEFFFRLLMMAFMIIFNLFIMGLRALVRVLYWGLRRLVERIIGEESRNPRRREEFW
jgi:hypothetical protein